MPALSHANPENLDRLDVWIKDCRGSRRVGTLLRAREAGSAYQANVTFHYNTGLHDHDAVSLLMPVSKLSYTMPVAGHVHILHPIFDQTLPEGALREHLNRVYAKLVPDMGDFELLRLLAGEGIGRVRFALPGGKPIANRDNRAELNALLTAHDSRPLMAALMERMAKYSNIAGVQPKVLAHATAEKDAATERLTVTTDHLIVKSSSEDFPWLAANEFLCMNAAGECGLRVPKVHLSQDLQMVLVERFDIDPQGHPIGFEDIACVSGRLSHQRYDGTYEEVVSAIKAWVTTDYLAEALESFFTALVFSCAIENGDAHMKNFGLIYRDPAASVALAPIYDLVCTTAYLKEDQLALPLNGSRRFPARDVLESFGTSTCGLSEEAVQRTFDKVILAVDNLSIDIADYSNENEDFERECGARMLVSLTRGMHRTFRLNDAFKPSGSYLTMRAPTVN